MPSHNESPAGRLPEWWGRHTPLLTALVFMGVFTYLGPVVMPLMIALFLFFVIEPFAEALAQRGSPRWLTYTGILLVGTALCVPLGQAAYDNAQSLQKTLPKYADKLNDGIRDQLPSRWLDSIEGDVTQLVTQGAGSVLGYAMGTAVGIVEVALMVLFYLLFLIGTSRHLPSRIRRAVNGPDAERLFDIGQRVTTVISGYMKVKFIIGLGMAAVTGIILYLFGVQYWLLWACLFFLLNYITYFGSLAACVFPIGMAWLQFGGSWTTLGVAVLIIVNRLIWIDYAEIRFSGRQLNIDQVLLLLSLAYWGHFWGIVGLVLAVPMLTCLKIVLENFEQTRFWAILISER